MVQLVSVAVPPLDRPPPSTAEGSSLVTLDSVAETELPLTVQLLSVAVPRLVRPPPSTITPKLEPLDSAAEAELPLMVQSVSVTVPTLTRPPPWTVTGPKEEWGDSVAVSVQVVGLTSVQPAGGGRLASCGPVKV